MTLEEIAAIGAVAGFASPIGLTGGEVVADELVMASPNLVAGANEEGWHLLDTNAGRDWQPDVVADIVAADDGDGCSVCGEPLAHRSGASRSATSSSSAPSFAEAFGATYLDPDGNAKPIVMGSLRDRRRPAARLHRRGAPRRPRVCACRQPSPRTRCT